MGLSIPQFPQHKLSGELFYQNKKLIAGKYFPVGGNKQNCFHRTLGKFHRAGIFKESTGARNRGGRGLSYRPARLHRLAEFIPWNQFRGHRHVKKYGLCICDYTRKKITYRTA